MNDAASPELVADNLLEDEPETVLVGMAGRPPNTPVANPTAPSLPAGPPLPEPVPVIEHKVVMGPKAPNFVGKTLRDVVQQSASLGMTVDVIGSGMARGQTPPPGSPLKPGEHIRVEFAR